ncbi:MAG: phenylalanine--tRNA ligase subunit beta, partial [Pseudomonadota bacterium]
MRVSLHWLKDYVEIEMAPPDLAHLLTMSGLEVEALEPYGLSLQDIIVAKILEVKPHPGADRLFICRMDTGKGEKKVVCGASNLQEGRLVPMALPGTELPGGLVVRESEIRGERSCGMLLAEDEMGLTEDHTGIMILPESLSPGSRLPSVMALEDWALEISITPNRPDCTSVIGIAREIAALTGKALNRPENPVDEEAFSIDDLASVTIDDPIGCPRYAAGMVRGVEIGPSPFWMRYRLHVSGVRSINNVVDVSNYVLLEMGQPLHTFDYDRLKENRIVVRRAVAGEVFTTLDGQSRILSPETLMICDGKGPVAVAGIMGGLNSEIFSGSENVLIESAFFDPITVRRGSKHLGLSTEASYRFERGIDIKGVISSLQRAQTLISRLAGGKIVKGIIDEYPTPYREFQIDLRVGRTNRFLGIALPKETMAGHLRALEMEVLDADQDTLKVKPPSFRVDIIREVDLMEEIARLEGYDKLPVTSPVIRPSEEADLPLLALRDKMREIMVGLGFFEIISYSFISPGFPDLFGAGPKDPLRSFVKLLNPLSTDQSVMRTSLLPGLLASAETNISHGEEDLRLFEWGKGFIHNRQEELPSESSFLAALMTGLFHRKSWNRDASPVDFYDMKGAAEGLLKGLGASSLSFQRGEALPGYDREFFSLISCEGAVIGRLGQIAEEVARAHDIKSGPAYAMELDIQALQSQLPEKRTFKPFPKYPAVFRDVSIVLGQNIESAVLRDIIEREGQEWVESVELFDYYQGERIGPAEKALTFRICYRSSEG